VTIDEATRLSYGQWLHHVSQMQGGRGQLAPLRVRVNGLPQTWKRDPSRIRVPVKWGMRGYGQLFAGDLADWHLGATCEACESYHDAKRLLAKRGA
jgi:hypothetical protein